MSTDLERDADVRGAYASDASGLHIIPDAVARVESPDEVSAILRRACTDGIAVTPAGAQTSTTGASLAESGILLSLQPMDRILELDVAARTMHVEAGALLGDVKRAAAAEGLMFPPDPTSEQECTIGGAIACNASGARTLKYGATRRHVRAVTVVLASGERVEFRRSGMEKNTAGYMFAHDPVDWFVGSEGTLGVVVSAELALLAAPERVTGLAIPFACEGHALDFVVAARRGRESDRKQGAGAPDPRCIEYFDDRALAIARRTGAAADFGGAANAMVYVEEESTDDAVDVMLERWLELAATTVALDDVHVFTSDSELMEARAMRHAVPATMNERGANFRDRGGRKVSTDWAVPFELLRNAITESRAMAERAGIEQAVTYGHAGNGHPHQNYLARDADELARINRVVEQTLRMVLQMGGTVSAEHGIGKLKRRWLSLQLDPIRLRVMRAVKRELDPHGILAPGNIFE